MSFTFRRQSLAVQVAAVIRREIERGTWAEWIPSSRELARKLRVSRNTCDLALAMLRREKLLQTVRGQGTLVSRKLRTAETEDDPQRARNVGLISPVPVSQLRPFFAVCIDELREQLFDLGARLHTHVSRGAVSRNCHLELDRLCRKHSHDCWILIHSTEQMQEWFFSRKLPCVVSGTVFSGITLPSLDVDYRGVCRHAAGKLLAMGHRRLGLVIRESRGAGDVESQKGFLEGAASSAHREVEVKVVGHNDTPQSVAAALRRLLLSPAASTGILVANSLCFLTVMTVARQAGFVVPEDVSLICRDDDPFLRFVVPEPARYVNDATEFAKKMASLVQPVLVGGSLSTSTVRFSPAFLPGKTIAAPP